MREVDLDHAFALMLEASAPFRNWLLSNSRFASHADNARLMMAEQRAARRARYWWKHWWQQMPGTRSSETDIFAVFEYGEGHRFALHVENKPAHGKLTMAQASGYRPRAERWVNNPRYLNYTEFETLLLAPAAFMKANADCAAQFDRCLSYEDVGAWVPLFAEAVG